jgi:hypothetical protein
MVSDRTNTQAQVSEQGGRFADGRPCIRVRSITTGVFNELMKASTLGNVAQIKSLVVEALMSRHRTIWDGVQSTWRQREGSRRACVRWRSWVMTERPTQQRHAAGVLGSDTGARGDSQGVGGGWS